MGCTPWGMTGNLTCGSSHCSCLRAFTRPRRTFSATAAWAEQTCAFRRPARHRLPYHLSVLSSTVADHMERGCVQQHVHAACKGLARHCRTQQGEVLGACSSREGCAQRLRQRAAAPRHTCHSIRRRAQQHGPLSAAGAPPCAPSGARWPPSRARTRPRRPPAPCVSPPPSPAPPARGATALRQSAPRKHAVRPTQGLGRRSEGTWHGWVLAPPEAPAATIGKQHMASARRSETTPLTRGRSGFPRPGHGVFQIWLQAHRHADMCA